MLPKLSILSSREYALPGILLYGRLQKRERARKIKFDRYFERLDGETQSVPKPRVPWGTNRGQPGFENPMKENKKCCGLVIERTICSDLHHRTHTRIVSRYIGTTYSQTSYKVFQTYTTSNSKDVKTRNCIFIKYCRFMAHAKMTNVTNFIFIQLISHDHALYFYRLVASYTNSSD